MSAARHRSVLHERARQRRAGGCGRGRRGLAPLELVLSLPILLFIMAAMISFGTAACWKVRTHVVARDEVWKTRWPRTGHQVPPPSYWPAGAAAWAGDAAAPGMLDLATLRQPVVRGELPAGFRVNEPLLNNSRGARQGHAELERLLAMLPKMRPYHLAVAHPLLDGKWPYLEMGIPANRFRRIPFIYELPKAGAGYSQAFAAATTAVVEANSRREIFPLDRDEEIRSFYGYYVDFHPRIETFCDLDREAVRQDEVDNLIDRIRGQGAPRRVAGVPETMTRFFIAMYEAQKRQLERRNRMSQAAGGVRIVPVSMAAESEAAIAELERKLEILKAFLQRLLNEAPDDESEEDGKPGEDGEPGGEGGDADGGDREKEDSDRGEGDGDDKGGDDGEVGEDADVDGGRDDKPERPDLPREDGPREDGPREDGPREDGPREDGPREDGPREDGPGEDGPRKERARKVSAAAV